MRKLKQLQKLFYVMVAMAISITSFAQTAKVQVIHNSADPAAASVAIWIIDGMNATKPIDNFNFRDATGYVDLPAGSPIKIAISAAGATSITDTIAGLTTEITLMQDSSYIVMATGNIGTNFSANPDSRNTDFRLLPIASARQTANNSNNVEFVVVHGATDVPAVDVYVKGSMMPLVDNAAYGDATPYYSVAAQRYLLDLTLSNSTTPLSTYDLDASNLAGGTAVIFASGYLNPSANSGGEDVSLFVAFANGTVEELSSATSKVQVIHNSADPAAANVAVWILDGINGMNATKAIDSLEFRKATGYVDVTAGSSIKIAISAAGAMNITDTIAGLTTEITLAPDSNYIVMATGNVGTNFAANPDNRNTDFRLLPIASARPTALNSSNVEFVVVHGATDVPAVDVYVRGTMMPLVDNAAYGDATPYYSVAAQRYLLDLTLSNSTTPLTTLDLDASNLAGGTAVIFASGYFTPSANSGGEDVGIFAAFADGTVARLNSPTANVQIIHNSADPAAANVAVWVLDGINGMNATKVVDNLEFRDATAFTGVTAGSRIRIAISAAGAMDITDTIAGLSTNVTLTPDSTFIVMAVGNVGTNFAPNPNGRNTDFRLLPFAGRQAALNSNNVEFRVVHGATDVPAVDVYVKGSMNPLVNDATYGDVTPYYSVAAQRYLLDLTLATSTVPLATFDLDASGLAGGSAVIFASGYLAPNLNNNGERIGLFVAFADGSVAELFPPTSKLQVIHNSAASGAASVDVYASVPLAGERIINDFNFRTATGFIDAPAASPVKISFAPANSTSIADTIPGLSQTVTLDTGKNYIAMAIGNVGTGFEANPDGENTDFRLLLVEDARTVANNSNEVDLLVIHGSTDAPTVDVVVEANNSILVNNAKYGDATGYASVMPTTYRLLVQDSGNTTTVASFDALLGSLAGEAAVVFASGYLTPANDNNGPAFGLFAAVNDQVIALTNTTSVYEVDKTINANVYPNPATSNLNIEFTLADNSPLTLEVFDNLGRVVYTETTSGVAGNNTFKVNTSTFNNGVYFYTLKTKEGVNTSRFAVSK